MSNQEKRQEVQDHFDTLFELPNWENLSGSEISKLIKDLPSFLDKPEKYKEKKEGERHKVFELREATKDIPDLETNNCAQRLFMNSSGNLQARVLLHYCSVNLRKYVPYVSKS